MVRNVRIFGAEVRGLDFAPWTRFLLSNPDLAPLKDSKLDRNSNSSIPRTII